MKKNSFCLLAVVLLAILTGCASEAGKLEVSQVLDGSGDVRVAALPIYNGYAPNAPEHAAVVGLHKIVNGTSVYIQPFCSGTLIDNDVVLTAAHCLDTAKQGKPAFQTMAPTALGIYVGNNPSVDLVQHLYRVTQTKINPTYNRTALLNDIALVRLAAPITETVDPVPNLPVAQGFTQADVGARLNFAGFGQTETGSSGVKLQMDLPLGSLGCTISGCPGAGSVATQIAYAQQAGGPCFGDSGGPAFLYRDGVPFVAGITSYGDSRCAVYGVSTRVDAFSSFIDGFVNLPVCGNGICDVGESCDGRNGTSSCVADCPKKTTKPTYCYVNGVCTGRGCP